MQKKPADHDKKYPERTLESLNARYQEFLKDGANRKNQAQYENVVGEVVVPIEPKKWCPPGLHMTTGGVQRIHGHLKVDASELDLDIGNDLAQYDWTVGSSPFDNYITLKKDILKVEERLLEIDDELDDLHDYDEVENGEIISTGEDTEYIQTLHKEADMLEEKKMALEAKLTFPKKGTGPVAESLDRGLNKFGIERQAYHGSCFVGNHCHKYLQEEVYTGVLDEMVRTVKTLTGNMEIIEKAERIRAKYIETYYLFSDVYKLTSHSKHIPQSEFPLIQHVIDEFLLHYRVTFPNSSIPLKFHLLEDHVVPWFKEFPFGFGLMGEQGSESVHAQVNRIKRRYVAVKSDTKRLKATIEQQHLKCAPELKRHLPQKKKYRPRKTKSKP